MFGIFLGGGLVDNAQRRNVLVLHACQKNKNKNNIKKVCISLSLFQSLFVSVSLYTLPQTQRLIQHRHRYKETDTERLVHTDLRDEDDDSRAALAASKAAAPVNSDTGVFSIKLSSKRGTELTSRATPTTLTTANAQFTARRSAVIFADRFPLLPSPLPPWHISTAISTLRKEYQIASRCGRLLNRRVDRCQICNFLVLGGLRWISFFCHHEGLPGARTILRSGAVHRRLTQLTPPQVAELFPKIKKVTERLNCSSLPHSTDELTTSLRRRRTSIACGLSSLLEHVYQ
eukprot:Selendium_serpulae@DN8395_c0_g1_i1.p1